MKYSENNIVTGTFLGSKKGYGFVVQDLTDEEKEQGLRLPDIYISDKRSGGAFHMDRVMVALLPEHLASGQGERREGEVVKILSHGIKKVVGYFEKKKHFGFVLPDDSHISQDIFVDLEHSMGAVNGHKVVAELIFYGGKGKNPEGRVIEILGHVNDPGTDILAAVRSFDLPTEFPKEVMKQVEKIPDTITAQDLASMAGGMAQRMDLREKQTVTIDGEDARDLDDAITIERLENGYELGVHIADVSHYVPENSPLDQEALHRGTSVYLVDRVIPMLPHRLSNGICSLNQGEDRLALSCIMQINEKGVVTDHRIAETVIRVDRRMTYTDVQRLLDLSHGKTYEESDRKLYEEYLAFVPMFLRMEELAGKLRKNRHDRGAIDFDFPESKIILNKRGKPIDIYPSERNTATRIIEDFMLLANETVAEDFYWQELPFLYRVHEKPDKEKMKKIVSLLQNYGYSMHLGREEIHPKEVQKVLDKMEGMPEEPMLSRILLRSMKQARYSPLCSGHFGLSSRYYTHFTSPIRRYPDLQIHRIIKENLRHGLSEERIAHYHKILPEVGRLTSELERRAEEAERDTEKMKKAEYMSHHIGEYYDGIISSITSWGIYVELPNTVEGCVRLASLKDDYYVYDREKFRIVGERTNRCYCLGQKVTIQVTDADKLLRTVDFALKIS